MLIQVRACPKFAPNTNDRRGLLNDELPHCESVDVSGKQATIPQCRDPFDRAFLNLAVAGQADVLVTGDADILVLADAFAVPMLSPGSFRRQLSGDEGEAG
ncbi:MAG: putative toxin-antitoxin system toxin component, PIN family [bacterium]|nr:putative toxin-antitoxin system toxin component, PIN family [bacterium]MDE0241848.1 putative toxin-antitoxin system toxin component, PIN family [bacterium]MDE0418110.1 putative toxin-antitoxin system toxin component, PIN family [bacterium]